MIFFYLPGLGLVHFLSSAALGFSSVLSLKALADLFRGRADEPPATFD